MDPRTGNGIFLLPVTSPRESGPLLSVPLSTTPVLADPPGIQNLQDLSFHCRYVHRGNNNPGEIRHPGPGKCRRAQPVAAGMGRIKYTD